MQRSKWQTSGSLNCHCSPVWITQRRSAPSLDELMRPSQLALNLGTPPGSPTRTSSDFEEVSYPSSHWSSHNEAELPMHYLSEDTARRRGKSAAVGNSVDEAKAEPDYSDEGKDVYNKVRVVRGPTLGGRPQRPPPPPASSLVSASTSCHCKRLTNICHQQVRVLPAEP